MIVFRCDREDCKAEAPAATKSGAKPKGWTIGLGVELCPECSRQKVTADEARKRDTA